MPPTSLFDRTLVRSRLTRARRIGYADFLLKRAVEDAQDRLAAVLRPFEAALDLGTPSPALAGALAGTGRAGRVAYAAPVPEASHGFATEGLVTLVADAEFLPFGPARFDLVTSLLALHAIDDLPGALVQIRQALKPDGLFLGCMLGGRTLTELRQCLTDAESEVTGGLSPRIAPFADVRDVGGLLQRAGLALPVTDADLLRVRYSDMFALMHDLRAMGLTNPLAQRQRVPTRREIFLRAALLYSERFADPDGRIPASFELIWMSGWAPHESQQKPLRPGSAKMRLADALGVPERSAGEKGSKE